MSGKTRPSLRKKCLKNVMRSELSQTDKDCIAAVFKKFANMTEVKPGKWLTTQNDTIRGQKFTCSICGKIAYCPQPTRLKNWVKHCNYEYCPHYGAKMDGKGGAE